MSLLCCLLVSVVGVLVLDGREETPAPPPAGPNPLDLLKLQIDNLSTQVQDSDHSADEIMQKISFSQIDRDNRAMRSRIKEMTDKINLANSINEARAEADRLSAEIKDQEQKIIHDQHAPGSVNLFGSYTGPYILIECIEDAAIIYPGGKRIAMTKKPTEAELTDLLEQIKKVKFVAFVVRPSGWYENSYDRLHNVIYAALDDAEKNVIPMAAKSGARCTRLTPPSRSASCPHRREGSHESSPPAGIQFSRVCRPRRLAVCPERGLVAVKSDVKFEITGRLPAAAAAA